MKNLLIIPALLASVVLYGQAPAPITGATSTCTGGTANFTDATTGGTWSSNNSAIASIDPVTGTVMAVSAGATTITYDIGTGYVTTPFAVNALPTPYVVSGTPGLLPECAGSITGHVYLSYSEFGVSYQLINGGSPVGAAVSGFNSTIDFGPQASGGTYMIIGSNSTTGCSISMTGNTSIVALPLPAVYSVAGGGGYCAGAVGTDIGLNSSSTGVSYQLFEMGTPSGGALMGTGSALNFGIFSSGSDYTVVATNTTTSCTATMVGTVSAYAVPLPTEYDMMGGGMSCGGAGVPVLISGSQPGVNYQLFMGGAAMGAPLAGTGATLDFGLETAPGLYTAIAIDPAVGCIRSMSGAAFVSAGTGTCTGEPYAGFAVAGSSVVCIGSALPIGLSGLLSCGTSYQWQSSPDGTTWGNISGATGAGVVQTPAANSFYRCNLTCISSGLSATSGSVGITVNSHIKDAHVVATIDTYCAPTQFYFSACSPSATYHVVTYFGDESSDNSPLSTTGTSYATISHSYAQPGTYAIKQILTDAGAPVDSVNYSYEVKRCATIPVKYYIDVNNNCLYDASEPMLMSPITTEVDSNGIAIDNISSTSGFYYKAKGPVGTIYGFKPIVVPGALSVTCPLSGITYDTIQSAVNNYTTNYIGLNCLGGSDHDLSADYSLITGRHMASGTIMVNNRTCTSTPATVTVHFDTKYNFVNASPAPASVSGNTITWDVAYVSSELPFFISFQLSVPNEWDYSHWLIPGDTINTTCIIDPTIGDPDTTNNIIRRCDTVKSSYDPNEMSVTPSGNVIACTPLKYIINFENTGNDVAHDIYVMDTLSDNLDIHSLAISSASAQMNIAYLNEGGHNIVKFDFPNINLLDSSHHGKCDGMVAFTIKTKPGLGDGTTIANNAGIYFDDNPVVLTNSVQKIIGVSPVTGPSEVCVGANITLAEPSENGVWTTSNSNASVSGGTVTGITAGSSTVSYTLSNACGTKTQTKTITINPSATAGIISGATTSCTGSATPFTESVPGGTWSSADPSIASISSGGSVTGLTVGTTSISYSVNNTCGSATATKLLIVNPLPAVFTTTGGGTYCTGSTAVHIGLSGSIDGNNYQLYKDGSLSGSPVAGAGAALDFGPHTAAGAYTVKATDPSTGCSVNMTASASIVTGTPPVGYLVSGGGNYCTGATPYHVFLVGSQSGAQYQLFNGSTAIGSLVPGTGAGLDFGLQPDAGNYTVVSTNTGNGCTASMPGAALVAINPLPSVHAVTGGGSFCAGSAGVTVGLDNSETGIKYQLYIGGVMTGGPVSGTGSAFTFGSETVAGTYTAVATNPITGCVNNMTSTGTVHVNALPVIFTVSGGGSYCAGGTGYHIALDGSETGINYKLYNAGVLIGSPLTGTGTSVDFGLITGAGTYTITAGNDATGCGSNMTGSASIVVNQLPATYHMTGGGRFCVGGSGVGLGLDGSQNGMGYQLYVGSATVGIPAIGTGGVIHFDAATIGGDYTVTAVNGTTSCTSIMTGMETVIADPLPAAISGGSNLSVGTTITLTDATSGGTWSSSNTTVANVGSATGIVYANKEGTATITYTIPTGCAITTSVVVDPKDITGIQVLQGGDGIIAYPNPTSGALNIQWQNQNVGQAVIIVNDIVGREVLRTGLDLNTASGKAVLELNNLKDGVYLLRISNEHINHSQKLQVIR